MLKSIHSYILWIPFLLAIGMFVITADDSFFWDTIQLASLHAHHYYDTSFSQLLLPDSIDSGHIPFFGMYLACFWFIFGKTLLVSHLAILPFILGSIWQLHRLLAKWIPKEYVGIALLLVFLDPTFLGQSVLVSPDVLLVFFFLLTLNGILENKKLLIAVGILFLFVISLRGMMVAFILFLLDCFINSNLKTTNRKIVGQLFNRIYLYLPALLIFLLFSFYHFYVKGWIGFHSDSPWNESFESAGIGGIARNIGLVGWRIIDFGRIGIWIAFFILLFVYKRKLRTISHITNPTIIFLAFFFLLPLGMIWAQGLIGHRYLLPIYFSFSILTSVLLFSKIVSNQLRMILVSIWLLILITGNLWVYPNTIAQGWDSSLAHLPYHDLRVQMIDHIQKEEIAIEEVCSFFPNLASFEHTDLSGSDQKFEVFSQDCKYVFYSNVFNIPDEAYESISSDYSLQKEFKSGSVFVRLYRQQ